MNAYYTQHANEIFPIYGVSSIEEARKFVPEADWGRVIETDEDVLMNPSTGSVDFRGNWEAEGYDEDDGLVVVEYSAEDDAWVER